MGMAASQCRFLQLTSRNNDIGRQLMKLSNDKMRLAQDMSKVSKHYTEALSAKTMKWTNNGGASYSAITYSTLMTPNANNNMTPYILSDTRGHVVVDANMKKYAEMISSDGRPNNNWDDVRLQVLSRATGIDEDVIANLDEYKGAIIDGKDNVLAYAYNEPNRNSFTEVSGLQLAKKMNGSLGISDWGSAYISNSEISGSLESAVDAIKNGLSKYFMKNSDKFEKACESVKANKKDADNLNVRDLLDEIFAAYSALGGEVAKPDYEADGTEHVNPVWYDVDSAAYQTYKDEYDAWEANYNAAQDTYTEALNNKSALCTSAQEKEIEFYDKIFSMIAKQGWAYNSEVSDETYLNNMLQNNLFTLTTVDRSFEKDSDGTYHNIDTYDLDIASNCKKIVSVNDDNIRNDALVRYEDEKNRINVKESRIDTRMKNLQTEQSAIQNMMKSIQEVINFNTKQSMTVLGNG